MKSNILVGFVSFGLLSGCVQSAVDNPLSSAVSHSKMLYQKFPKKTRCKNYIIENINNKIYISFIPPIVENSKSDNILITSGLESYCKPVRSYIYTENGHFIEFEDIR